MDPLVSDLFRRLSASKRGTRRAHPGPSRAPAERIVESGCHFSARAHISVGAAPFGIAAGPPAVERDAKISSMRSSMVAASVAPRIS